MALLRKALIQCRGEDKTQGEVIAVTEVSERGFGGLRAGNDQLYWDCTRWVVAPGDVWREGIFYTAANPGEPVEYIPSAEEQIAALQAQNTQLEDAITGMMDTIVSLSL